MSPLAPVTLLSLTAASYLAATTVSVEVIISPALSSDSGAIEYNQYSLPVWDSTGQIYFKSHFLDFTEDLPKSGLLFHKLDGPNASTPLVRDDAGDFGSFFYSRFGASDDGSLYFDSDKTEDSTLSVYRFANGAASLVNDASSLVGVGHDGTVIIRDFVNSSNGDVSKIPPGSSAPISLVRINEPLPSGEGELYHSFGTVHFNPAGRVALVAKLKGEGVVFANDHAILRESELGVMSILAREGDPHPADERLDQGGLFIELEGNKSAFAFNKLGYIAFTSQVTDSSAFVSPLVDSLWRAAPNEEPKLILIIGRETPTANAGPTVFTSFRTHNSLIADVPMLDASGTVYFFATTESEEEQAPASIWKFDGTSISKIVTLDSSLPLPEIDDPKIEPFNISVSSSGRIALLGTVSDGQDGLAAVLWAQDENGAFAIVASNNLSPIDFPGQTLSNGNSGSLGKINLLQVPTQAESSSGSEDGTAWQWWTPDDRLLFVAKTVNDPINRYTCLATIGEPKIPATGDRYTWDGGIETTSWLDVAAGRTNWIDSIGARWNLPPNRATAEVLIPNPADTVNLADAPVTIGKLSAQGALKLSSNLTVEGNSETHALTVSQEASLTLHSSSILHGPTAFETDSLIFSPTSSSQRIENLGPLSASGIGIHASSDFPIVINNEAEINAGKQGILANSTSASINIASSGNISSITSSAIEAHSAAAISIRQSANLSAKETGIYAYSTGSDVSIDSRQATIDAELGGILGISDTESVTIQSGSLNVTGANALEARAATAATISAQGQIDLISGDAAIRGISSTSSVTIDSAAKISATGLARPGIGIWTTAEQNISITQRADISTSSVAILARSVTGNITIDASQAELTAEQGAFILEAPLGAITVASGTQSVANRDALVTKAQGDIQITNTGPIFVIGDGNSLISAIGIWAASEQGSVTIASRGSIDTFDNSISSAIFARAQQNVTLNTSGSLSTYRSDVISARSTNGSIDVTHRGDLAATDIGRALFIQALAGPAIISLNGSDSQIETLSDNGGGIVAEANQSIKFASTSYIRTNGANSPAVSLESETAGIALTSSGDITALGPNSDAIVLSGPSIQTVTLPSGTVTGSEGNGVAVRFKGGTENRLVNHAQITATSDNAIHAGDANLTVDNYGSIAGNLLFGTGSNLVRNYSKASLHPTAHLDIGPNGILTNEGTLKLGNDEGTSSDIFVTGSIRQTATGVILSKQISTSQITKMLVEKSAELSGSLLVNIDPSSIVDPSLSYELINASAISGTFDHLLLSFAPLEDPQALIRLARQHPSRKAELAATYTATTLSLTLNPLTIETYSDWYTHFFSQASQTSTDQIRPYADDNLFADPDGDGLSNLEEYAFGTHPNFASANPIDYTYETASDASPKHSLRFPWAASETNIHWQLAASPNLVDWTPLTIEPTKTETLGELTYYTFEYTDTEPISFLRLAVEYLPSSE